MFPLQYEGDLFRPPSEAKSLIIQATIGCSHNRCTFCGMYKRKKYRVRTFREIESDMVTAARFVPLTRRVFLADGNALAIPTGDLVKILQALRGTFPRLERVTLYGNPQDLLEKSVEELAQLRNNGLGIVYLGVESGSSRMLEMIKKGVTPEQVAEGAGRAKKARLPLSVTIINGLAGVNGSREHAEETARLLNRIDPEYLGLLSLMTVPGTTMHRQFREGLKSPLGPWELLEEIRMMVEGLSLSNCVFRANHASNYLPIKAVLSQDKEQLLAEIERVLNNKAPGVLKSEYLRGL